MASVRLMKILMLGSGMVAPPCLECLSRNPRNRITLACRALAKAEELAAKFPDIPVIRSAINSGIDVVTTSYVSDAMRELDEEAKRAGIVVLNEVVVDPSVDHLYVIKKIEEVHAKGGKVLEFYSYCGGLPAPDCADNTLGFKFSWSLRGALLSQRNSARFLKKGSIEEISPQNLMASAVPYYIVDGYDFVVYPNRNSVPFREFYDVLETHTVIRGSLRYKGNSAFDKQEWLKDGMTWAEIQQKAIGASGTDEDTLESKVKEVARFPSASEGERIIAGLKWMGILFSEKGTIVEGNVLDTLCVQLEKLMSFGPGERDLVML
ncbi:saccharopine dehydrogenase [Lentithecium fluviatile CBS 122367]|uniref:Saccharopine dehydrogenase n=1 Tax=Lentithecium fluviatile CBS 122367 TaxID=1168545 RepID=A0A6G1J9K0_9PLEO|nr:saccharopine dehydrogenase [Lentithecium fluviatile CBS 122367]